MHFIKPPDHCRAQEREREADRMRQGNVHARTDVSHCPGTTQQPWHSILKVLSCKLSDMPDKRRVCEGDSDLSTPPQTPHTGKARLSMCEEFATHRSHTEWGATTES